MRRSQPVARSGLLAVALGALASAGDGAGGGPRAPDGDARVDFSFTQRYAAKRSDYLLRRAAAFPPGGLGRRRLLDAAIAISPGNATVLSRAKALGGAEALASDDAASLQVGPTNGWAAHSLGSECKVPTGMQVEDLFPTPIGFAHISQVGIKNWKRTLAFLRERSVRRFDRLYQKKRKARQAKFMDVNNQFFQSQETNAQAAMEQPGHWPKMYGSALYAEWVSAAKRVCSSYVRGMGVPLTKEEQEEMELILWAAVYPDVDDDVVSHMYHAHQESIVSFVLFVSMPSPATPMVIADPRGMPPVEDYEWFQDRGDLGVDAEPPFHRTLEFFAGEGDIVIFPSFAIHKVPPHIGRGSRVAWPGNCLLPKRRVHGGNENPFDGWERVARWPGVAPGGAEALSALRPGAPAAYLAGARAALSRAASDTQQDPYMKVWEAQNQVLAVIASAPGAARTWLEAGNLTAHIAVSLAARDEGDYFPDAAAFWAQALRLDPSVHADLQVFLRELAPARAPPNMRQGYERAKPFVKAVRAWQGSAPAREFTHFLLPELNGPGRCSRMCPDDAAPDIEQIAIAAMFGTRVYRARLAAVPPAAGAAAAGSELEELARLAHAALAADAEAPEFGRAVSLSPSPVAAGCWQRNETASLSLAVCDRAAELWFADPRGAWPERWGGALEPPAPAPGAAACPGGAVGARAAAEPKAPFHWHRRVLCSEGEALLFPAWLPVQVAPGAGGPAPVRAFAAEIAAPDGPAGWRWPPVRPMCRGNVVRRQQAATDRPGRGEL